MTRLNEPFAMVPLSLLKAVSGGDAAVYMAIDYRCGKRGYWRGQQSELAELTGLSERTIERAVANLRAAGYLETKRIENGLRYMIVARTIDADEADTEDRLPPKMAEGSETAPAKSVGGSRQICHPIPPTVAVSIEDDAPAPSQPSSQISSQDLPPPRTREPGTVEVRDLYWRHFGHEGTAYQLAELATFIVEHGRPCVDWVLSEVGGAAMEKRTWRNVRFKFGDCAEHGHGPRERVNGRTRVGANGSRRPVRSGNGAGAGGASGAGSGGPQSGDPW